MTDLRSRWIAFALNNNSSVASQHDEDRAALGSRHRRAEVLGGALAAATAAA